MILLVMMIMISKLKYKKKLSGQNGLSVFMLWVATACFVSPCWFRPRELKAGKIVSRLKVRRLREVSGSDRAEVGGESWL